jgi:hypothetical protein
MKMPVWVLTLDGVTYGVYRSLKRAMASPMRAREITWSVDVIDDGVVWAMNGECQTLHGETQNWTLSKVEVTDGY